MITLTDSAATKIGELISAENQDGLALRITAQPGGCSGPSYELYFDTDRASDDVSAEFGGVDVLVDSSSVELLVGATLDFRENTEDAGFSIDNPGASHECGCGHSSS